MFSTFVSLAILALPQLSLCSPKVLQLDFERREVLPTDAIAKLRRRGYVEAPVFNAQGDLLYLVNTTVGTPGQKIQLQLDTGSSDIWIPSASSIQCSGGRCLEGKFDQRQSSTYSLLDQGSFQIQYVDGTKINGDYISDNFGIGGATVPNMTMGLANVAVEQDSTAEFQGIIGIGYEEGETVFAQTGYKYRNLPSRLKEIGAISSRSYSLWLNDKDNGKGSILFGGIDTEKYKEPLVSLPVQADSRTGTIVSFTVALDGIEVIDASNNVAYSQKGLGLPVILDSGTTITYLPNNLAQDLQTGVGAVVSNTYGAVVPCDLAKSPATFNFRFGNTNGPVIVAPIANFVLDFPPDFPSPTFRSNGKVACRWGLQASNGKPNLFGDTFLRGAYVVYNIDNNEVAIANAIVNTTKSNIKEFTGSAIPGVTVTATGLAVKYTASGLQGPNTLGFGLGGSQITTAATGATFNLGPTGGSNPSKKAAASHMSAPRYQEMFVMTGIFTVLMFLGGSFVLYS